MTLASITTIEKDLKYQRITDLRRVESTSSRTYRNVARDPDAVDR
jgi:hypothetical protein